MNIERIDFVHNYETRDCFLFINGELFVEAGYEEHGSSAYDLIQSVANAFGERANRHVYFDDLTQESFDAKWGEKI